MLKCKIKLTTKQSYDSHTASNEQTFQGKVCKKNDHIFIIFKEEDKENNLQITNHIKVAQDGSISVRRMGDVQSTLYFAQDQSYRTFYDTGHGPVELLFIPTDVIYNRAKLTHQIELRYSVHMGESKLSDNVYKLEATSFAKV